MQFHITCACGRRLEVDEGSAGALLACECGWEVRVPSLHELRKLHGLPPYNITPELLVEYLYKAGELPPGNTCARCGLAAECVLETFAECERSWRRRRGPFFYLFLLLGWMISGVLYLYRDEHEAEQGKDLILPVPLRVCPACQQTVEELAVAVNQSQIKQLLRQVPAYDSLLDKYPDARILLWRRTRKGEAGEQN